MKIPLFFKIHPVLRPRWNPVTRSMWHNKDNQRELVADLSRYKKKMIKQPIIVDRYIYFEKVDKSKNKHPIHRQYGDIDNLTKGIFDALVVNGILHDDQIIVGGEEYKSYNTEDHALVLIWSVANEPEEFKVSTVSD